MKDVLLDLQGNAPVRDGYFPVASEVEFLKHAVDNSRLQVRGVICDWALTFCQARALPWREIVSPISELLTICPKLDEKQAKSVYDTIGSSEYDAIERPLTVRSLLNVISPGRRWHDEPSVRHAAEWLLWLIDFRPQSHLQPLLVEMCQFWTDNFPDRESVAYSATDEASALAILDGWLGINPQPQYTKLREFPFTVPASVKSRARELWNREIVESKGACLDNTTSWPNQNALKKALAEEAYKYFKKHHCYLTHERFDLLATFLSWQEQKELQVLLPPPSVGEMPKTPESVLVWFRNEYLPYRRWQFGTGDETARNTLNERAKSFGRWYLENYPQALSGGEMRRYLSFDKTATVAKTSRQTVTLIVVLDGLHAGDAHSLQVNIQELAPRLSLASDDLAFAALPTVTEFCKEALFKGVPPVQTDQVQPIGVIIPESESPISRLTNARPGEVFLWRVQEPDHTYHSRNKSDALIRKVEAELESSAKMISDIVEQVPADVPLQLLITTDHGRLIGVSKRNISIPHGMESHGRAAWGKARLEFPYTGYTIRDDVAFLSAERFGMAYDVAIPLNDGTFLMSDGKAGQEAFAHGGLFPEEVIIPWIAFVRDDTKPNIKVRVTGRADAGKPGTLMIAVTNLSDVDVALTVVDLDFGGRKERLDIEFDIPRQSAEQLGLDIQQWPSNAELGMSRCNCQIMQPNGLVFAVDAVIDIQSDEMYRSESILEDLL